MNKLVILNVGGALSAYAEFGDKKVIIDLGSSSDLSPVNDFLIPLAQKRSFIKTTTDGNTSKYYIDQLFLSHLDKDHISDYNKFRNNFHPDWMTCPNDNQKEKNGQKQDDEFLINLDLIGEKNETRNMILEDMRKREPLSSNAPLGTKCSEIHLYYIKPKYCEYNDDLKSGYANNISLVLHINNNGKILVLPGDILKEGMKFLIDNCTSFKDSLLNNGIDYLIAPHHGLQTSFSEYLFQTIKGNKTKLNIISEKVRNNDSDENRSAVDGRYYDSNYSTGDNSLNKNAVKTSLGHIIIDFEDDKNTIHQFQDIKDVIKEFTV